MSREAGIHVLRSILSAPHRGALACDPGGTTGLSWVDRTRKEIYTAQVPGAETYQWVHDFLMKKGTEIDVLVVEQHIPKPGTNMGRDARLTMELVGKLEAEATLLGKVVVRHNPSQMKTVPWMNEGVGVHARDATKHLVRFLLDDAADGGVIRLR